MRLRTFSVTALALVLAGAIGAPLVAADPPGAARGRDAMRRMADELNLTAEQREQIRQIVHTHREGDLGQAAQAARTARTNVRRLVHDPQVTEEQIRAAVRAGSVPAEELALARHRLALAIQQVLTAEQRERAQAIGFEFGGPRGRGGRGMGFGPGDGPGPPGPPEDDE